MATVCDMAVTSSDTQKVVQETRDRVLYEAAELYKEIRQAASELRKEKSTDDFPLLDMQIQRGKGGYPPESLGNILSFEHSPANPR